MFAAGLAASAGIALGIAAATAPLLPLVTGLLVGIAVGATLRSAMVGLLLFVVVVSILPFAVVPIRIVFSPTFIDVVLTALLCSWGIRVLHRDDELRASLPHLLLAIFAGLATVSLVLGTALAPLPADHLRLFLKLINSFLLFFSVVQVVRSEADLIAVTRALIVGAVGAAAIALSLYLLPSSQALEMLLALEQVGYPTGPDVLRPIAGTETLRATGTSVDPNVLAAMLMIAAVLIAAQFTARRPVLPRWLLLGGAAVILPAIALTFSRSSWVGLAAGVAILATFRDRRLWIVAPAVAIALAVAPQGQTLLARLASGVELRDPATLMRLSEYDHALGLIAQYPLFGVGFGEAPRIDLYVGVSSMYLLLAEHTGILGLSAFLATVVTVLLRSFLAHPDETTATSGMLTGLQASMIAALVASLFDQYFFSLRLPHMSALFWLLVGLLVVAATPREARVTVPRPRSVHDSGAHRDDWT